MKKLATLSTATLALGLLLVGCAQKSDVEAVQATQKEILAKLEKMEKDQATILARVQAGAAAAQRPGAPAVDPNQVYEIPVGSSYVRGPKDAPVTITMFSDFQCPFCARATPIVDEVMKAYPNDVNFVMKQFPLMQIHPGAEPAARGALAAGKQGKFWEMHDEMYKIGRDLNDASIKAAAGKLGLDTAKFEADYNSPELKKQVQDELALGQKVNVRGTPTFFINGKIAQNRSVEGFKAQVDEELKKKKG
jgi:protein-disulfide isomerase